MRISTGYQYHVMNGRISDAQSRVFESSNRVLTGKRFDSARQDPGGARMVVGINGLRNRLDSISGNIRTAKEQATLTETALTELGDVLSQARQLGLQANQGTLDATAREALASQIDSLKDRLVSSGNAKNAEGGYIFAGQATSTKPFTKDNNGLVTYQGDDLPRFVEAKPGEQTRINMEGAGDLFTSVAANLDSLKNAVLNGNTTDALAQVERDQKSLIQARGVNGSQISLMGRYDENNSKRIDDLTAQASDIQEIDLAEAMTEYQRNQTAYEAALRVASSAQELSLMDFLR